MQWLNDGRKLDSYELRMDAHNRLLLAMAEADVPHVRQLIRVCLRQKKSIVYIADQIFRAQMA